MTMKHVPHELFKKEVQGMADAGLIDIHTKQQLIRAHKEYDNE